MLRPPRVRLRATANDSLNLDPSFACSASPTDVSPEGAPQHSPRVRRPISNGGDGTGLTRYRAQP